MLFMASPSVPCLDTCHHCPLVHPPLYLVTTLRLITSDSLVIRTQKSLNKFTLCQAFYSTLITLSRYGFSLQFLNCPKYWWSLCYCKLILTLSAESVSPHLDLTCLKTLFTMTRQVPGFYLATFRYLELSDFNTADNHLVLCNNIFTAPRPPFKYFWALSA